MRRAVVVCAAWGVLRLICLADRRAPPTGELGLGLLPSLALDLVGEHVLQQYLAHPLWSLSRAVR